MEEKKKIENILFLSSDESSDSKSNRYHVAKWLSKKYKVIFVERQFLTVLSILKKPSRIYYLVKMFRVAKEKDKLLIVTPPLTIPGNISLIKSLNIKLISLHLKYILKKIDIREYLTWVVSPNQLEILKNYPGKVSVYHCHDGYGYYPNENQEEIKCKENKIKSIVDIIFYASRYLYNTGGYRDKSFYIGHGFDPIFLNHDKFPLPEDMRSIPKPIVGFHGILNFHTNVRLLEMVVKKNSSISFVFVGALSLRKVRYLYKYENLHFLGQKRLKELPGYLNYFDLAILPYRKIPMTNACSPLKLYEYLACGIPILSEDIPEVHMHKEYIHIAKNEEHFCRLIPELLSKKSDRSRQKKYAEDHLWPKKVAFIIKKINEKQLEEEVKI